jgi:hypothetical protein
MVLIVAALAAFVALVLSFVLPVTGLFFLVAVAAFLDYPALQALRLFVGAVPVNLIDIAVGLTLPGLLVYALTRHSRRRDRGQSTFAIHIGLLVLIFGGSVIGHLGVNSWYDITRDAKTIVVLAISYLMARRYLTNLNSWHTAVHIIAVGGIYGIVYMAVGRLQHLEQFTSYIDLRNLFVGTPSMDLAIILPFAFVASRYYPLHRRSLTWAMVIAGVSAYLLSFTLTSFAFVVLVPLIATALADLSPARKVIVGLGLIVPALILLFMTPRIANGEWGAVSDLARLVMQPFEQLTSLSTSRHFEGRLVSWTEVLSQLDGASILFGKGVGQRMFIDTGVTGVGEVLLGEPTYSTYLLGLGALGLVSLLTLHLRLVTVALHNRRHVSDAYTQAIMLGFAIYGTTTIINACLHNNFLSPQVSVLYGVVLALTETAPRLASAPSTARSGPVGRAPILQRNGNFAPEVCRLAAASRGRPWAISDVHHDKSVPEVAMTPDIDATSMSRRVVSHSHDSLQPHRIDAGTQRCLVCDSDRRDARVRFAVAKYPFSRCPIFHFTYMGTKLEWEEAAAQRAGIWWPRADDSNQRIAPRGGCVAI